MKVLFVGSHLDKGGGQAFQTLRLFRELRTSIDGEYLCLRSGGPHTDLLNVDGVRVVGRLRFPQGIRDLRDAVRAERGDWDVVQIFDVYFGLPAVYLARAFPRTVLFGMDPITEIGWRYGVSARTATRFGLEVLMAGTGLTVNSPALATTYARFDPTFVPNGLDLDRFVPSMTKSEARRHLGLPEDGRLVLWVGKVVYSKRIEWLFETLRRVPHALVVAVGGFNEEHFGDRYLRETQARYPDVVPRASFVGEVPFSRIALYLTAADVFAFPSRFEGMPNALMEAMASGLPVVASDIPAHRVLVRTGQTGILAGDAAEFAERIAALLDDPAARARLGAAAQEYVRSEFTFARVGQRYLELYRRMRTLR